MGSPILYSTITTICTTAFMFGESSDLFWKFLICTGFAIFVSFLVSLLFFGSLMHFIGPQQGTGYILSMCQDKEKIIDSEGLASTDFEED